RTRCALSHRDSLQRSSDVGWAGIGSAALHVAGGCALRPCHQAGVVGGGTAGGVVHRGCAGQRVPAHRVQADRNANHLIPRSAAARSAGAPRMKWQVSALALAIWTLCAAVRAADVAATYPPGSITTREQAQQALDAVRAAKAEADSAHGTELQRCAKAFL